MLLQSNYSIVSRKGAKEAKQQRVAHFRSNCVMVKILSAFASFAPLRENNTAIVEINPQKIPALFLHSFHKPLVYENE